MSDTTKGQTDLRAIPARMERDNAENQTLNAEHRKLIAEEQNLRSERDKLRRANTFAPWQVAVTMLGAGAVLFAAAAGFMK
jgi:hypothetical protein